MEGENEAEKNDQEELERGRTKMRRKGLEVRAPCGRSIDTVTLCMNGSLHLGQGRIEKSTNE